MKEALRRLRLQERRERTVSSSTDEEYVKALYGTALAPHFLSFFPGPLSPQLLSYIPTGLGGRNRTCTSAAGLPWALGCSGGDGEREGWGIVNDDTPGMIGVRCASVGTDRGNFIVLLLSFVSSLVTVRGTGLGSGIVEQAYQGVRRILPE